VVEAQKSFELFRAAFHELAMRDLNRSLLKPHWSQIELAKGCFIHMRLFS
jgi:hypothetical protein